MGKETRQGGSYCLGLDSGSVSLNAVVMAPSGEILAERYERLRGEPLQACRRVLAELFEKFPPAGLRGAAMTGSGGALLKEILGGFLVNEVLAQSQAAAVLHPEVRSVIEMGGEDSKLLIMRRDDPSGPSRLEDFAMNTVCAAGTGSFLDQQAARIGVSIEDEFARLALRSEHPPRIAGRCSVFAKSDMIHLQQIATPVHDIVAGLCQALAANFKSSIAKGKNIEKPVAFQGGVAANGGMVRAFRDVLGLEEGELIIPRQHASMGAIGAVLLLIDSGKTPAFHGLEALDRRLARTPPPQGSLTPLSGVKEARLPATPARRSGNGPLEVYLGIDVGSISTNVVALDTQRNLLSKRYLMTASRPIEAVRTGLREVGEELGPGVVVRGVGTTGSGRYLIGDYVGADVVRNEITAQATAALLFDPEVDTVFEIGGQDSKYIGLRDGAVVDFEMNKVCAAGTGSFIEEQAERLAIPIDGEFGRMALAAPAPPRLGERCTVFMDSDLVKQQQRGTDAGDLAAGLCYSIVHNYLNKVVGDRAVGKRIFFQGGVAFNDGVVAAFREVTGTEVAVPPHHDVTGAMGAAILAMEGTAGGAASTFKGFDLTEKGYRQDSFECKSCPNQCEINRIRIEGEKPLFYGGRCEKYEVQRRGSEADALPDYFKEREDLLLGEPPSETARSRGRIGVPRALHFYEFFPFWRAFLEGIGYEAVPSPPSTGRMIRAGLEAVSAESCFPLKLAMGHVLSLVDDGVDTVLLPSIISFSPNGGAPEQEKNVTCPYSQAVPYLAEAVLGERLAGVRLLRPVVDFQFGRGPVMRTLLDLGGELGVSKRVAARAAAAAFAAQERFRRRLREQGAEVLRGLEESGGRALVLVGRTYNTCDQGMNLDMPRKLREMGWTPLPMEFLPLEEAIQGTEPEWNMYWRTGQRILAAARWLRGRSRILPVYLTNFGCGPDSFISHHFKEQAEGSPYLQIEIDEHSADAGVRTRLEAFLDSLPADDGLRQREARPPRRAPDASLEGRTIYLPPMADHARILAAAFRAIGQPAEVLPESDEDSVALGRTHTSGKECYPCIVTTGDIVRRALSPGFDPKESAFFMPTGDGPCRFGQYRGHHARVLASLGFPGVPLLSPDSKNAYGGLDGRYRRLVWPGILAIDVLGKLLRHVRPYAVRPDEAERIYEGALARVETAVAASGTDHIGTLRETAAALAAVEQRREVRPRIGVVGEIFLRSHAFSNEDLVRKLERYGGEVELASIAEWIFYTNFTARRRLQMRREYRAAVAKWLEDRLQRREEKKYVDAVHPWMHNGHEPPVERLLDLSLPYVHHSFEGEAVLTVGKSIDYALAGAAGVVSAMPFTCMPGTISSAISRRVREDLRSLPVLNMVYDGQGGAGSDVRIEAFIHQARQYHERWIGEGRA